MYELFSITLTSLLTFFGLVTSAVESVPVDSYVYGSFSNVLTEKIPQYKATSTSILFTGDIMLARNVENLMNEYGPEYPFSEIISTTLNADYTVGNFESSLPKTHVPTPNMVMRFSVREQLIECIFLAGFDYLSLANNHAFDYGYEGYENATKTLNDNSIVSFGYPNGISTSTVTYIDLYNGETVALIGLQTLSVNYTRKDIEKLFDSIENKSDYQIIYIHWGEEYKLIHNRYQEAFARMLVDEGADLIVGHHPHVVEDIDIYNGVPIFYSLGNFVFDQYFSQDVQEGLVVSVTFEDKRISYKLSPITSIGSKSMPRPMAAHESKIFLDNLSERSAKRLKAQIQSGNLTLLKI